MNVVQVKKQMQDEATQTVEELEHAIQGLQFTIQRIKQVSADDASLAIKLLDQSNQCLKNVNFYAMCSSGRIENMHTYALVLKK